MLVREESAKCGQAFHFLPQSTVSRTLLCRVVSGIGVTLIQPVYYSSMFSGDKVYVYQDDFDRSELQFDIVELESTYVFTF